MAYDETPTYNVRYCDVCKRRVWDSHRCSADEWQSVDIEAIQAQHEAAGDLLERLARTVVIQYTDGHIQVVRITD